MACFQFYLVDNQPHRLLLSLSLSPTATSELYEVAHLMLMLTKHLLLLLRS